MAFVILGLLMLRNLSQYDIRNVLQQKISPFISASLGSIQAALKKLENDGHVTFQEVTENGRRKKLYTLNDLGREHFMEWMLSSITPSRFEQEVTTRLFFLGFMTPAERLAIIRAVVAQLETSVQEFSAASVEANRKEVPENVTSVVAYQLKTLDLGLYYHQSMLTWFEKFAMELEAELGGEQT
ncbi:PadR family transcriptional regulator [Paenibacillus sp. LHD-38]|uniref:PadR family transcriptional regulator n=1 Tax=Paenibacillus sp. LHD-38 TaxID=3072143 RepID=UPI00280D9B95|nr:PadR family transcriptional regulator [Paenibacillus sp. LHD-38]MDQ8738106.1 PadR family transcriptional regulator [Paenibacillus sp. LHD-38]